MANFEVKYKIGSEIKSMTITASDESAAGHAFRSSHQGISTDDVISVKIIDRYATKYGEANFVTALVIFVGRALVILGVIGAIASILFAKTFFAIYGLYLERQILIAITLAGAGLSFLFILFGLLMAAVGQHLRATTDAANSIGEILALMKSNNMNSLHR